MRAPQHTKRIRLKSIFGTQLYDEIARETYLSSFNYGSAVDAADRADYIGAAWQSQKFSQIILFLRPSFFPRGPLIRNEDYYGRIEEEGL